MYQFIVFSVQQGSPSTGLPGFRQLYRPRQQSSSSMARHRHWQRTPRLPRGRRFVYFNVNNYRGVRVRRRRGGSRCCCGNLRQKPILPRSSFVSRSLDGDGDRKVFTLTSSLRHLRVAGHRLVFFFCSAPFRFLTYWPHGFILFSIFLYPSTYNSVPAGRSHEALYTIIP